MKKNNILGLSVFLLLMCFCSTFSISEGEIQVTWLWEGRIQAPFLLCTLSLMCFGAYLFVSGREKSTNN